MILIPIEKQQLIRSCIHPDNITGPSTIRKMKSNNSTVINTPSPSNVAGNNTVSVLYDACISLVRYSFRRVWDKILFGILFSIGRKIQSFVLDIKFLSDFEQWFLKVFLGDFYRWVTVHLPVALHALECVPSCLLALAFLSAWSLWNSNTRIASLQQEIDFLDRARIRSK